MGISFLIFKFLKNKKEIPQLRKKFKKNSIKNINLIKFYPKVYTTLKYLKKNIKLQF